ncbi:hypothetical protein BN2537_4565 [Streptomyces venezuelae]|nr:hypothetical protein BN2537_4565 [Streptomyces venezuelae]
MKATGARSSGSVAAALSAGEKLNRILRSTCAFTPGSGGVD